MFWSHGGYNRTILGSLNPHLPTVCDSRVLLFLNFEDDKSLAEFAIGPSFDHYVLYLCDFDQNRCLNLLKDRSSLEEQIGAGDGDAQVTFVHRNYYVSIEGEEDMEYPKSEAPGEWQEHLQDIRKTREARADGHLKTPVLEFDEGPSELREKPRLVFTRSLVWLPYDKCRNMSQDQLALSSCGIVCIPNIDGEGHILVFDS